MEPAHKTDAHPIIPAIESAKECNLSPQKLLAGSLYGSDDNYKEAQRKDVELITLVMGAQKEKDVYLRILRYQKMALLVFALRDSIQ